MGTFSVQVEVSGAEAGPFVAADLLVDTGATYTVLPRRLLAELGVQPHHRGEFGLGDGSRAELEVGRVWLRFEDRLEHTLVVFGEVAALGAVTLEELNRVVDPIHQRLVPVIGLLMRLAA